MTFERKKPVLPDSWTMVSSGDLGTWSGGGTPSKQNDDFWKDGTIPWVSPKDMKTDRIYDTFDHITPEALGSSPAKTVVRGSTLVVVRSGILRHTLPVAVNEVDVTINQDMKALTPHEGISSDYVSFALKTHEQDILHRCTKSGTTVDNIVVPEFMKYKIPLAPPAEQRRIVGKIEELFSKVNAGIEALEKVQILLKQYRASVLKAACEGRLVPTEEELARLENRDYEPADQLLKRILQERRHKWEEIELAKMKVSGRTPNNEKWKAKYKEPAALDTNELPKLPKGWVWTNLDCLSDLKGGVTKDQKRQVSNGREVPYLRVANVQRGYLDMEFIKTIRVDEQVIQGLELQTGDILFTEGGDRDKLGRGWIWQDELPECIHQNHIFRARLYLAELQPKFISWFGNVMGQEYFMKEGTQTTNLASVNLTKLKAFPVALPPTTEQARIVSEVERLLSVIDELEKSILVDLGRSSRVRQSILKSAFEGKLVPQDPKDESAEKFLEGIAAERAMTRRKKKTSRRRRKSADQPELFTSDA